MSSSLAASVTYLALVQSYPKGGLIMPRQLYLINFVIAVCVGYGLTLVGSVCPAVAQTAPLQVTLTTNKSQYSLNDPIVVTI